jgi:enamine deaminase RidA (YjgF/YER057c/UK114 family)
MLAIARVLAALALVAGPASAEEHFNAINPATLADGLSVGYSQVTLAKPGRLIFMSGQVGWDTEKVVVGDGSFATQTAKALENVRLALDAAGATPRDVVLIRYYIVGLTRERVETMASIVRESRMWDPDNPPAGTVLGVEKLAFDELLIEIEAIAVLPDSTT